MSLLFMDGFNTYDSTIGNNIANQINDHWNSNETPGAFEVAAGRYGGFAAALNRINQARSLKIDIPSNNASNQLTVTYGFNFFLPSQPGQTDADWQFLPSLSSAADIASRGIGFSNTGINIRRATLNNINISGTLDLALVLDPMAWHSMEVQTTRNNASSQSIKVFIDDVLVYDSVNFSDWIVDSASETIAQFIVISGGSTITPPNIPLIIDDFYVLDNTGSVLNDRIGSDFRIETLLPSGTRQQGWDVTGGDSVSVLRDIPTNSGTFINTNERNLTQEYFFENLSGISQPSAGQIRSLVRGDNGSQIRHTANTFPQRVFDVDESFTSESTIFGQGTLSESFVNDFMFVGLESV